jgi:hypothetical protein
MIRGDVFYMRQVFATQAIPITATVSARPIFRPHNARKALTEFLFHAAKT